MERNSQGILQAHLKTAEAAAQAKFFKRTYKADQKKIELKKYPTHSQHSMTRQLNNENGLQSNRTKMPNGNSVLLQLAVTFKIEAERSFKLL